MKIRSSASTASGLLWVCLFFLAATQRTALGQDDSTLRLGLHVQKNAILMPGVKADFSTATLLGGRPHFSFAYVTSRARTAMGDRGLVEDRFLVGVGWFFRRGRQLSPFGRIDVGYTRYNREDAEIFALLDNDAMIFSVIAGLEIRVFESRFSVSADAGYSILQSSTVFPFVTSLGIYYSLNPPAER